MSVLTLESVKKQIRVASIASGYYMGRVIPAGKKFRIPRHLFSPNWMVAIDEEGKPKENQPKKLDTKEVKALFDSEKKKKKNLAVEGKKALEELGVLKKANEGNEDLDLDEDKTKDSDDSKGVQFEGEDSLGGSERVQHGSVTSQAQGANAHI